MQPASILLDNYQKADALLLSGDLQQAADICKQMLTENPNFAYGYHLMASLFRTTGNVEKALGFSELAIMLDPAVPAFFMQQGQLLLSLNRFAEAENAFLRASDLQPNNVTYLLWRADIASRQGKQEEARTLFAQARTLGDETEVDMHEGISLLAAGELDQAEIAFERAIKSKPLQDTGYLHKGKLLLIRGRDREAEVCFAKALNCNPHAHEALYGLSIINERQGQLDAALALAIQAVNANGAIFDSLVLLGQLLLRKQNWHSAEQIFQQTLSVVPDNLYVLQGLISALSAQGKLATLCDHIRDLIVAKPDNKALAYLHHALSGENPLRAPAEYVTAYFNDYAERYDYFLQPMHLYRSSMICDALLSLPQLKDKSGLSLLDLGCGAGEAGDLLYDITQVRVGIDLAIRMLDKARMRKCYQDLYALDIVEFVMGSDRAFDIIIAADVLPYIGDLEPFITGARNVMSSGSLFAFTVEKAEGKTSFQLHANGRYSHGQAYVQELLSHHGYDIVLQDDILLRFHMNAPVKGMLFVIKKMAVH